MAGCNSQFEKFLTKLMAEVREGIRHGFFDYRLRGEVVNGRKRQLILEAGKKYKFTIPQEELDQQSADDPDWKSRRIGDS